MIYPVGVCLWARAGGGGESWWQQQPAYEWQETPAVIKVNVREPASSSPDVCAPRLDSRAGCQSVPAISRKVSG